MVVELPAAHEIVGVESTLFVQVVMFLVFSLILIKCASLAVKYIVQLAQHFNISEFVTSFLIAGFVSILPEFFIGVNSAIEGIPEIGIGAIIGNNIVDLTLVIGIVAILGKSIPTQRTDRISSYGFLFALGLPLALMVDGFLSQVDGIVLVLTCIIYFILMLKNEPICEKKINSSWEKIAPELVAFGIMVLLIFVSSHFVVTSAVEISHFIGFPEILAGLILISIGAALPELTFSIQAVMAHHKSVALGDVLGNVVLDATFSIGVMAIIFPFPVHVGIIGLAALFMVFSALMVTTYMDDGHVLTRRDGIALIGLFIVFVVVQITLNTALGGAPHP
ncbi:MAG: sodium:calcium antiporter [Candidatus Diapherotrites archaeon]|uniref:Sodium:calcium antiporter n=1 Tax=Candidatus Iainarchaeum sp. TaxID=3101447 RepID=A0A8T4CA93_9ARCH|nr:sodium:calcium antiporter [Candidatus Diapherotrites archaeon]